MSAWKWDGLLYFIAVATFAYGAQFAIPDIVEPLHHNQRTLQPILWRSSALILTIVYVCCGITISMYFGDEVEDPCTLAWKYYRGFEWTDSRPIGTYIIAWIILLFPPFDMMTAFPLHCITLANTIEQSLLKDSDLDAESRSISRNDSAIAGGVGGVRVVDEQGDDIDINNDDTGGDAGGAGGNALLDRFERFRSQPLKYRYKVILRGLIIVICAGLALLMWNFDFILILSGILTLISLNGIISYAELKSQAMFKQITNDEYAFMTPVSDFTSGHPGWAYIVIAIAAIGAVGIIAELAANY